MEWRLMAPRASLTVAQTELERQRREHEMPLIWAALAAPTWKRRQRVSRNLFWKLTCAGCAARESLASELLPTAISGPATVQSALSLRLLSRVLEICFDFESRARGAWEAKS